MQTDGLTVVTPPAVEPLTLAEAKAFLRIEHDQHNDLVTMHVKAAREELESKAGRALVTQTLKLTLDAFPSCDIELPRPPLASVTHIKYDDADGAEQTVDAADYVVDTTRQPGRVSLAYGASWPSTYGEIGDVRITYVAGHGADGSYVPAAMRQAVGQIAALRYENPTVNDEATERAIDALIGRFWTGAY